MEIYKDFPGADLVIKGLENLQKGKKTEEAFLVLIGAPRLRRLGIVVPQHFSSLCPELSLYKLLLKKDKASAYSLYNSYLRRLISFEQACEQFYSHSRYNLKSCEICF
jgi:hypothetical protein